MACILIGDINTSNHIVQQNRNQYLCNDSPEINKQTLI